MQLSSKFKSSILRNSDKIKINEKNKFEKVLFKLKDKKVKELQMNELYEEILNTKK
mgnify:CR=1 FL=1